MQNAIARSIDTPNWPQLKERKPRVYKWGADDPLSDVLLLQLGAYPAKEVIHIDYESMFKEALDASEVTLSDKTPLPAGIFDHPSIGYLSRHRLHRHYSIQSSWGGR